MDIFEKIFESNEYEFEKKIIEQLIMAFDFDYNDNFFKNIKELLDIDNITLENTLRFFDEKNIKVPNYIRDYKEPKSKLSLDKKTGLYKKYSSDKDYCGRGRPLKDDDY